MDGSYDVKPWHENDGFLSVLSEPFALTAEWNELAGMPSADLMGDEEGEYERQIEEFEKHYWRASVDEWCRSDLPRGLRVADLARSYG